MMTLALGWFSASLTGRRERMEMRDIEGDWRASERMAAPAVPVAPVRTMWDILFAGGSVRVVGNGKRCVGIRARWKMRKSEKMRGNMRC